MYDKKAELDFDFLLDSDFRYIDEPEVYERLLAAIPEEIGIEMGFEGKTYRVFMTKERPNGPDPLWISYVIERDKHRVRIIDIRRHPRTRSKRK